MNYGDDDYDVHDEDSCGNGDYADTYDDDGHDDDGVGGDDGDDCDNDDYDDEDYRMTTTAP